MPAPEQKTFAEQKFSSLKRKLSRRTRLTDKIADFLTYYFGTVTFFNVNALFFVGWFLINAGMIPGFKPFDPYPYGFLTLVVSLEAIFLTVIVLISQNQESDIAELREQFEVQLNVRTEEEITKILSIVDEIQKTQEAAKTRRKKLK